MIVQKGLLLVAFPAMRLAEQFEGNPTLEFDSTECKSHEASSDTAPQSAAESGGQSTPLSLRKTQQSTPTFMNARYDGLTCFVWERLDADTLRIEITNHADGCSENEYWQPSATLNAAIDGFS